jgi:D-glycero-D-manno-heptose 1,7-bisphosphate phosphatase
MARNVAFVAALFASRIITPHMNRRPAVFFDRDNTLVINDGYLGDPAGVKLMPGAAAAVARARRRGFVVVVVSNQSGVARGMFSEDDVRAVNARMDAMLLEDDADAVVDRHEFCPTHPKGTVPEFTRDDDRRKPGSGMLTDAAKALNIDLSRSWLVGDAPRDIEAGQHAGCRTVLLKDPILAQMESAATNEPLAKDADYTASSLSDAMDFVEMHAGESLNVVSVSAVAPTTAAPTAKRAPDEQAVLLERILDEIRRGNDPVQDFSVAKMIAGVVQGLALAAAFAAVIAKDSPATFTTLMLIAIFLQAMTTSLLLMGR